MKKLLTLIFVVAFGLVLTACGNDDDGFQVDVFIYEYSDTYIGGVRTEMENLLKEVENVSFKFHDAASSQETQNTQIDNAIAAGTDLLVVNIVETGSGSTIVTKAKNNDLPIIFFNREVDDSVINSYDKAVFVGTDPDEAGYMQGELIADLLLATDAYDKYDLNDDGKINYIMLRSNLDNPEANGRTQYSVEEANRLLQAAGKPVLSQIGSDQNAEWRTDLAKTATDSFLQSNPFSGNEPIELVIANNDDMALGAIQSLNEKGYNTGTDATKYILVVGVDATATAKAAIADGKMAGSIKQDGEAMAECIVKFIENTQADKAYNEGTDYEYETSVDKVRIPYAKYTG
jgi:methyl-galactoside transport system substrate-binding protein